MKWIEVTVRVAPKRLDLASDLLRQAAPQGIVELDETRMSVRRVRAYLPAGTFGRSAVRGLRRRLTLLGATLTARVVSDTLWVRAAKAGGRRVRVGRVVVQPTWMRRPRWARVAVVRLAPGLAFGSGEHESTQLCLRALTRYAARGATVIDLGTGSGILAIAAARLGAGRVLAIDCDPIAVTVARANTRANRVDKVVSVQRRHGLAGVRLRADLLVANLTADTLPPILARARRCLAPGGRLVVSGFTAPRLREVRRALVAAGFAVTRVDRLRAWRAVHAAVVRSR